MRFYPVFLLLLAGVAGQAQTVAAKAVAGDDGTPQAPAVLPGAGLAYRDFLYAGMSDQTIFIVKKGKVAWSHRYAGSPPGHIQEATVLPNGNLLLAHMSGIKEITPERKTVWSYVAPAKAEVQTAKAIGNDKVLFVQNEDSAKVFLADKRTGKVELLFTVPVASPKGTHLQTRRAVLTAAGTLLLARTDMNKVSEFDQRGNEVWSAEVKRPWSVQRLENGNTLVCSFEMFVRELDSKGRTVWELVPKDIPEYVATKWNVAKRLRNGNTLVTNNAAMPAHGDESRAPVQAFEITPDKKIVWALRSWNDPAFGPAWELQFLDEIGVTNQQRFGNIRP